MKNNNSTLIFISIILAVLLVISGIINYTFIYNKPEFKENDIKLDNEVIELSLVNSEKGIDKTKHLTSIASKTDELESILNTKEQISGVLDGSFPDFKIKYLDKVIYLWFDENSSMIMDANDSNTGYTINKENTAKLSELLTLNKFKINYKVTKTYNILNVTESNDEDYIFLTLRKFNSEEVYTAKILNKSNTFVENTYYEFTFNINYKINENFDNELFEYAKIESMKETDKEGLEQVQETCPNV